MPCAAISISRRTDGILERYRESNTRAKVMHIDSSGEYWQGRASLVVTDEAGHKLKVLDEVRVYLFSGRNTGTAGLEFLHLQQLQRGTRSR